MNDYVNVMVFFCVFIQGLHKRRRYIRYGELSAIYRNTVQHERHPEHTYSECSQGKDVWPM